MKAAQPSLFPYSGSYGPFSKIIFSSSKYLWVTRQNFKGYDGQRKSVERVLAHPEEDKRLPWAEQTLGTWDFELSTRTREVLGNLGQVSHPAALPLLSMHCRPWEPSAGRRNEGLGVHSPAVCRPQKRLYSIISCGSQTWGWFSRL